MQSAPKLAPGVSAPDFTLPATDGSSVSLQDTLKQHRAVLVTFICNHCPYVKAYIPRLIALQNDYADKLAVLGICSNDAATYPDDDFDAMKAVTQSWGLNFKYLRDESQEVARAYGGERTPEFFLLDQQGVCRYEGGFDDNYQDTAKVTDTPLKDAIEQLLADQTITRPVTHAIGCSIKWKK